MTRAIRKSKNRRGKYEPLDIELLTNGPHCVPCMLTEAERAGDDDAIKAAWGELGPSIMRQWFRTRAGIRPWAWWHCCGHTYGRRERIDARPHPFDDSLRKLHIAKSDNETLWRRAYALNRGMPAAMIPPYDVDVYADFMANVLNGKESTVFEPEWTFLVRHGLLLPEDSP